MNSPEANTKPIIQTKNDQLKTKPHFLVLIWPRAATVVTGRLHESLASDLHKCHAAEGVILQEAYPPFCLRNLLFNFMLELLI